MVRDTAYHVIRFPEWSWGEEAEALCGAAAFLGHTKVYAIGDSLADDVSHVVMPAATKSLPLRGYFAAARGLWCAHITYVRA